jgi:hypothetical protein
MAARGDPPRRLRTLPQDRQASPTQLLPRDGASGRESARVGQDQPGRSAGGRTRLRAPVQGPPRTRKWLSCGSASNSTGGSSIASGEHRGTCLPREAGPLHASPAVWSFFSCLLTACRYSPSVTITLPPQIYQYRHENACYHQPVQIGSRAGCTKCDRYHRQSPGEVPQAFRHIMVTKARGWRFSQAAGPQPTPECRYCKLATLDRYHKRAYVPAARGEQRPP